MDYIKQLLELRNELHKKIIFAAIRCAAPGSDQILELNDPLDASFTIRSRESDALITTHVTVTGIDCTTGELVAATADGTQKKLYYNDLALEQLAWMLKTVESSSFTLTEKYHDRHLITVG